MNTEPIVYRIGQQVRIARQKGHRLNGRTATVVQIVPDSEAGPGEEVVIVQAGTIKVPLFASEIVHAD